ncbi:MAG TPA: acyltransferase [Candidatus Saccharimonadales bacterium]|nr:acyltransferase [Candidatus Saccharimonadales bacterium]
MEPTYTKFRNVRLFSCLDGLRAFSIIGVIWFHSWWGTPYYSRLAAMPVLRNGSYGVHIFFVVSGFLITTLLLREKEAFGVISLRNFYLRRVLRIWPLYYAVLALYVVIALVMERGTSRGNSFFHYLPSFATFTYTWFISANWPGGMFNLAWTLATEEQFYLVWPIVLRFLRSSWSSIVILGTIALKLAADHHLTDRFLPVGWLPTRIVLSIAVSICMGVLLAQALHWRRGFTWLYYLIGWKWSAPVMLVAMLISLAPAHVSFMPAFATTTALVGACVIREDNGLSALLVLRPIAFIGTLSYGMYLFNSMSVHVVRFVLARLGTEYPPLIFVLAVALATAMAYLSYRYYEAPFLALKSKYARLPSTRAPQSNEKT